MTNANKAVAKAKTAMAGTPTVVGIEDMIRRSAEQLRMALPAHLKAERIVRIGLTTLRMNPKLYECDFHSFLGALFQCAQLGLEPNVLGEAYIIPYRVRNVMTAQFQIGYLGLIKLFWNHESAVGLQVETVYKNDDFNYDLGENKIHHVPPPFGRERGEAVGYYAAGRLREGGYGFRVISKEEALAHAKRFSKCWDAEKKEFKYGTPWRDHFDAMAMKTAVIKLLKFMPKSVEIQRALAMDQTVKLINPDRKLPETDLSLIPTLPGTFENEEEGAGLIDAAAAEVPPETLNPGSNVAPSLWEQALPAITASANLELERALAEMDAAADKTALESVFNKWHRADTSPLNDEGRKTLQEQYKAMLVLRKGADQPAATSPPTPNIDVLDQAVKEINAAEGPLSLEAAYHRWCGPQSTLGEGERQIVAEQYQKKEAELRQPAPPVKKPAKRDGKQAAAQGSLPLEGNGNYA